MTDRDDKHEQQRINLLADLFDGEIPSALSGQLLRTADVAALFEVSERTVSEWARRGHIPAVRTPGGHRRYPADQISRLIRDSAREGFPPPTDDDPTGESAKGASSSDQSPPAP